MACSAWSLPNTYMPQSLKCGNKPAPKVFVVYNSRKIPLCWTHHREWNSKGEDILKPRLQRGANRG